MFTYLWFVTHWHVPSWEQIMGVNCGKQIVGANYVSKLWEQLMGANYGSKVWEQSMGANYGADYVSNL